MKRNKKAGNVRNSEAVKRPKLNKKAVKPREKMDRRVLRTRDALGDALVALMHEKDFDEIRVQDVLNRAGIGRATFYAHYQNKNDLFVSDVEDFLEQCSSALKRQNAQPSRLLPVREFFAHIRDMREFHAALLRSRKLDDVWELARGFFARSIEERLQAAGVKMEPALRSAQAHALAGSFFSILDWWIARGMKADPKDMDAFFHKMAWRGLVDR
jgi:AcrR family transcriptional regulator